MLRKIEELRKQPIHVRNRYAFWIALCCTLVIAFIWSIAVPLKLMQKSTIEEEVASEEPQSSFFNTLGDITGSLKNSLGNLRPNVEYEQKGGVEEESVDANTIDLDALYASSSLIQKQRTATKTASSTRATSTPAN